MKHLLIRHIHDYERKPGCNGNYFRFKIEFEMCNQRGANIFVQVQTKRSIKIAFSADSLSHWSSANLQVNQTVPQIAILSILRRRGLVMLLLQIARQKCAPLNKHPYCRCCGILIENMFTSPHGSTRCQQRWWTLLLMLLKWWFTNLQPRWVNRSCAIIIRVTV